MTEIQKIDTTAGDLIGTTADRGAHHAGLPSKYTPEERNQLRALGGLDEASDADIDMLQAVANRADLDPFLKEIYLVGRKTKTGGYRGDPERWETKWTVQTSIDGFRKVTHRYAEQRGKSVNIGTPLFYTEDGQTRPFWLMKWGYPAACEITVKVGGSEATTVAVWDEYVQTKKNGEPNSMWSKMGTTMLGKCAEAQAHRRLCPLSAGMYLPEEMGQANNTLHVDSSRQDDARGVSQVRAALAAKKEQGEQDAPALSNVERVQAVSSRDQLDTLMGELQTQVQPDEWAELVDAANSKAEELG